MTDPTNPAPPAEELLPVEQSDREAAAALADLWRDPSLMTSSPWLRRGYDDHTAFVQAFAKHRLDHLSVLTVENERMREADANYDYGVARGLSLAAEVVAYRGGEQTTVDQLNAMAREARAALSSLPAMKGEG